MTLSQLFEKCEKGVACIGTYVIQPVFILLMRLYWGWQFFQAGFGKLKNMDPVIEFFSSLGIPWPIFNAYLVGTCETVLGLCILVGLFSRLAAVPLTIIMCVAYGTAHLDAVKQIFIDPKLFIQQEPFLFLVTVLIVWSCGPGIFSLDYVLRRKKC